MSAYFKADARPVLSVLDAAEIRAEPSALLRTGTLAVFSSPGLFRVLAEYDEVSTVTDDGTTVWKPDDKGVLDPGRWTIFGGESGGAHTYVKRKVDGSIDGLTADFSNPFVRTNYDVGPNDPVPAVLCGHSVDRGAILGVERDRAALVWDEPNQMWNIAFTQVDDTAFGAHLPVRVAGLYSRDFGANGFIRLNEDDAISVKVAAATHDLAKGTAAGVAHFGSATFPSARLEADGDVLIRSVNADVELRTRELQIFDAAGANQLLVANPSGDFFRVIGDLEAYNGASPIFFVDVSASMLGLLGLLKFGNAALTASSDFTIDSAVQTTDATATTVATIPVPSSGSVGVLAYAKGVQSDGSNGFSQLAINSARRSGAAAPTLSQGATGIVLATLENTFAIVKPSYQFVISGNDLLLQVVGKAATTINWLPFHFSWSR